MGKCGSVWSMWICSDLRVRRTCFFYRYLFFIVLLRSLAREYCSDLTRTTYMFYVRIPLIVRCRTLPVHITYTTPTRSSFYAYK